MNDLNKRNLLERKFGRLKVIKENGRFRKMVCWDCVCDCGKVVNVPAYYLTSGQTQSCGCLQRERTSKASTIHGDSIKGAESPLYRRYRHMIERCENPNNKDYVNYGGRGISVCNEWRNNYLAFKDWSLKNGYEQHLTIDRIDVNGNYEPCNCRWITLTEQENNRRDNVFLVFDGVRRTVSQWAKEYDTKPSKIYYKKKKGWSDDEIKNFLQAI